MERIEILKTLQEIAEEHGFEYSQSEVKDLFKVFEETVKVLGTKLEVGESFYLGIFKIEKRLIKAKSGVSKLGETEKEWSTPEREIIKISAKKSFEKETTIIKN